MIINQPTPYYIGIEKNQLHIFIDNLIKIAHIL